MLAVRSTILASCVMLLGCGSFSSSPSGSAPPSQSPDFTGIRTATPPETAHSRAEKQAKLHSHLLLAQGFAEKKQFEEAIPLLEQAVMWDPEHRAVLLLLTQCLQRRSKELSETDPGRAYGLMVQSGGYLRTLRRAHQDFSPAEQAVIANILFDEMCAHARSNRHEETSGSLQAAIDAGFDDVERLQSDPDLKRIREYATMNKLLDEAAESIRSRATQKARQMLASFQPDESLKLIPGLASQSESAAASGEILLVIVSDSRQSQEAIQQVQSQAESLQLPDLTDKLRVVTLDVPAKTVERLPSSPAPPALILVDRTGSVRVICSCQERLVVLQALVHELAASK